MVYTGILLQEACEELQPGASFPAGLTLELSDELLDSIITWTVPYKHLSNDQQRAAWLMNDSSKLKEQHPGWKATTVIKEGKITSAQWADMHAVFLAVMEELSNGKCTYVWGFLGFFTDSWAMENWTLKACFIRHSPMEIILAHYS